MGLDVSLLLELEGEARFIENGGLGEDQMLGQMADADAPKDADLTLVRIHLSQDHLQESRLPVAVCAHDADLLPCLDETGGLLEEDLFAKRLADSLDLKQCFSCTEMVPLSVPQANRTRPQRAVFSMEEGIR